MNPAKSFWNTSQVRGPPRNGVIGQMQHPVRGVRTSLDHARTSPPQRLVTLYRLVKLFDAVRLQQFCQGYCVLDCKVSTLPMMRQHAVRGIAHQYGAAALPGPQRPDFEQPPAKVVRHGTYHLDNGRMPTLESGGGRVMSDRCDPIVVRPGRWSFDNGKKIYVRSRWTEWKVQEVRVGPHPKLNRMRVRQQPEIADRDNSAKAAGA